MRFILLCLFSIGLIGCQEKLSYSYLMQHPLALKKEVERCNSLQDKVSYEQDERYTYCKIVAEAATNFNSLLMLQQQNPQEFGQRIMQAESECIHSKELLEKTALRKIKSSDLKQCEDVKIYLGVLSLSSPE